jgi:methylmalonyl-CoA mutase N-terminal domain/subunit
LIAEIDAMGGAVAAIESGWMSEAIGESAYRAQQAIERGEASLVGVNAFVEAVASPPIPIQHIDASSERAQIDRLRSFRERREPARLEASLTAVRAAAEGAANLVPAFIEAVDAGASVGEISDVLRSVFGTHVARERIA